MRRVVRAVLRRRRRPRERTMVLRMVCITRVREMRTIARTVMGERPARRRRRRER